LHDIVCKIRKIIAASVQMPQTWVAGNWREP
jgi:hypothetical protein